MVILPFSHGADVLTGEGYTTGINEGWYTHYSFENYCPLCNHYNCLERGLKRNDEISCYRCGADYSFSGKDKTYNPRAWLTAYEDEPETTISKTETFVTPQLTPQLTPLQIAHTVFRNNSIL